QRGEREGRRDGPRGGGMPGKACCPGMENMPRMESALREAGATDEQVAQLREQGYQMRKQMIALRAEKEQAELEVQHLLGQDKVDREAVMKAVETLGAVETSLRKLRVQQQLDVREIVGPDTCSKLRERAFERRGQMRDERGGKQRGESWGGRGEEKRGEEGWRQKRDEKKGHFQAPPEPEDMPETEAPPAE
ncbi:MAG: periplasmic heavy metal sensor, partial [Verrucomicrobia bacterium]|nr:periplasmic heavy metal sensor [Verrucomicrobiota bacterium]